MTGASPQNRDNSLEPLPQELREQLRDRFDLRYKLGSRRSWNTFQRDWMKCSKTTDKNCPSTPTVRDIIDVEKEKKEACEYRVIEGLCQLLLDDAYDDWIDRWKKQNSQSEKVPVEEGVFPEFNPIIDSGSEEAANRAASDRSVSQSLPLVEHNFSNWRDSRETHFDIPTSTVDRPQPGNSLIARIAATFIIAGMSSYFAFGSQLAIWANQLGKGYHLQGEFLVAQFLYKSAAFLNPRKGTYPYNLGWMCDQIADRDCAIKSFQASSLRGFPDASAELGRLYLLEGEQSEAFRATQQCFQQALRDGEQAACWKNLGWLRVQKQQWEEAETALRRAIDLNPDSAHTNCLLAQVLEANGKLEDALPFWIETLEYVEPDVPEHDECKQLAKQRLKKLKI